jgi:cytidylate kinase
MLETLKLIERHVAMRDLQTRLHGAPQTPGSCEEAGVKYGPCRLISRECGSGGVVIAQRVGERLGWNVFDRQIVDEIARVSNQRRRLVESVDEHIRSLWDQRCEEVLTASDVFDKQYLHYLRQVVLSLGYHGKAIIIGRGAQYLLPSRCAVRARFVAPLELRIKRVAEREELSLAQAGARVREFDAERASFVWKLFKQHSDAPLNYDPVISTAEISFDQAASILIKALRE